MAAQRYSDASVATRRLGVDLLALTRGYEELALPRRLGSTPFAVLAVVARARRLMLSTCISVMGSDASPTWVDPEFLSQQDVHVESEIPFWRKPSEFELMRCDFTKGVEAGLTHRPLEESIRDTWALGHRA